MAVRKRRKTRKAASKKRVHRKRTKRKAAKKVHRRRKRRKSGASRASQQMEVQQ